MTKFQTKLFSSVLIFIMLFGLFSLAIFILSPLPSQAQTNFQPQIGVGNFKAGGTYPISNDTGTIAKYIRDIYSYAIGIVGILATVVMMFGGVLWLTAGGNPSRIGEAKTWITASLTGLLLTLTSYMILATVNPALVDFSLNIRKVGTVEELGCCEKPKPTVSSACAMVLEEQCESGWSDQKEFSCNSKGLCALPPKTCCAFDYAIGVGYRGCINGFEDETACKDSIGWTLYLAGTDFQNNKQCKVVGKVGSVGIYKNLYGCE